MTNYFGMIQCKGFTNQGGVEASWMHSLGKITVMPWVSFSLYLFPQSPIFKPAHAVWCAGGEGRVILRLHRKQYILDRK